jgi:hypothetical protein
LSHLNRVFHAGAFSTFITIQLILMTVVHLRHVLQQQVVCRLIRGKLQTASTTLDLDVHLPLALFGLPYISPQGPQSSQFHSLQTALLGLLSVHPRQETLTMKSFSKPSI